MKKAGYIGNRVHSFIKIDSTNNYATTITGNIDTTEGEVVRAREQTSGRGQAGNHWDSEPGMNLTFSIILFPVFLTAERQFFISKAISLGIFDFLSCFSKDFRIKWPNDIYFRSSKIGGILIENTIQGNQVKSTVAGIGLNINQLKFPPDIPNPVSLAQVTGKPLDTEECFASVCLSIEKRYDQLKEGQYDLLDKAYLDNLFLFNRPALYRTGSGLFTATITGVCKDGRIRMRDDSGKAMLFSIGEFDYVPDRADE